MNLRDITKIRCGTFIQYFNRAYIVVGMDYTEYCFYLVNQDCYTSYYKMEFDAIDVAEITGYMNKKDLKVFLVKLKLTMPDGIFEEFEPVRTIDVLNKDYIDVTNISSSLVPLTYSFEAELKKKCPYMSIKPDMVIRAIDMMEDGNFVNGKIEVILAKGGYTLLKRLYDIQCMCRYLPAKRYDIKGEMTYTYEGKLDKVLAEIKKAYEKDIKLSYQGLLTKYSTEVAEAFANFARMGNEMKLLTLLDFIGQYTKEKVVLNEINEEVDTKINYAYAHNKVAKFVKNLPYRQYLMLCTNYNAVASYAWLGEILC